MNSATKTYQVISWDRYNTVMGTFTTEAAAERFAAKLRRRKENESSCFGVVEVVA